MDCPDPLSNSAYRISTGTRAAHRSKSFRTAPGVKENLPRAVVQQFTTTSLMPRLTSIVKYNDRISSVNDTINARCDQWRHPRGEGQTGHMPGCKTCAPAMSCDETEYLINNHIKKSWQIGLLVLNCGYMSDKFQTHFMAVCDFQQSFTTEVTLSLNEACPIIKYGVPVVPRQEIFLAPPLAVMPLIWRDQIHMRFKI